jgi:hypothetical protein
VEGTPAAGILALLAASRQTGGPSWPILNHARGLGRPSVGIRWLPAPGSACFPLREYIACHTLTRTRRALGRLNSCPCRPLPKGEKYDAPKLVASPPGELRGFSVRERPRPTTSKHGIRIIATLYGQGSQAWTSTENAYLCPVISSGRSLISMRISIFPNAKGPRPVRYFWGNFAVSKATLARRNGKRVRLLPPS